MLEAVTRASKFATNGHLPFNDGRCEPIETDRQGAGQTRPEDGKACGACASRGRHAARPARDRDAGGAAEGSQAGDDVARRARQVVLLRIHPRPAERQVRDEVVLSKEQGSLPPSAGNTAAPSRFGG